MRRRREARKPCPVHGVELVFKNGQYGPFYSCPESPDCNITGDWDEHNGKFIISTIADRIARGETHAKFDALWKSGRMTKDRAYKWLARELGLHPRDAHIKQFDAEMCRLVIRLVDELQRHFDKMHAKIRELSACA